MEKNLSLRPDQFLKTLGVEVTEPTYVESKKSESRTDVRKKYAEGKELGQSDLDNITHLLEVLGTFPIGEVYPLAEEEVDALTDELLTLRGVKDMLDGREQAIRSFVFGVVNQELERQGRNPEVDSGYILSEEYGVKLSKEVSGGKPSLDVEKLKEVLEPDQFASIINKISITKTTEYPDGKILKEGSVEYEINEKLLQDELVKGNIGVEQLQEAVKLSPRKTAFYVRKTN